VQKTLDSGTVIDRRGAKRLKNGMAAEFRVEEENNEKLIEKGYET
jgi:hypothetical protein